CSLSPLSSRSFVFSTLPRPRNPALFPYTTLFRSDELAEILLLEGFAAMRGKRLHAAAGEERSNAESEACAVPHLRRRGGACRARSEEHTSELQSLTNLVCRLLLDKKTTQPRPRLL